MLVLGMNMALVGLVQAKRATVTIYGSANGGTAQASPITVQPGTSVQFTARFSTGNCPRLGGNRNTWYDRYIVRSNVIPTFYQPDYYYPSGSPGPCASGQSSNVFSYIFNQIGTYTVTYELWKAYCNGNNCTSKRRVMRATFTVYVSNFTITMKGQVTGTSSWAPNTITVSKGTSMVINAFFSGTCPTLPQGDNGWWDTFIVPPGVSTNLGGSGSYPLSYPPGTQGPCQQGSATAPLTYTFNNLGTYTIQYQLWAAQCGNLNCTRDVQLGSASYVVKVVETTPVQALQITASLQASTCVPDTVTVTALDAQGNPVATTGTLSLVTGSGHGNWTLLSGNGAFTPGTADSGTATYQYAAGDNGTAQFALADVHADNLLINGTLVTAQPPRTIVGQSGTIQFRDNAFVFIQTAPPVDGVGVVVAGRPGAFRVDMIRRDPTTGSCGPAPGYNVTAVKAWIQRTASDPGGIAPKVSGVTLGVAAPATNNLPIAFANGVATFSLATADVGQYSIDFKDNSSGFAKNTNGAPRPIIGSSNILTVRPFALAFSAIQAGGTANPGGTTPAAAVFTAAGRPFSVTLEAIRWQSGDPANGVPTGPVSAAGRAVTPNFASVTGLSAVAPFAPAQGTLGILAGGNIAQSLWNAGSATNTKMSYSEVGSVSLKTTVTNYLGSANAVVGGLSTAVGRFIPDHFTVSLNTPQFATACTSSNPGFTYLGQAFLYKIRPVATLTAENVQNAITKNYRNFTAQGGGNWFRLTNSSLPATAYTDTGHPLDITGLTLNGANPLIANPSPGVATLTFSAGAGLTYSRPAPPAPPIAPFNASPTLSQQIVDLDGVKSTPNPLLFSAIPFSAGPSMRYGRIRLKNAYGSELLALPIPMQAQYYQDSSNGFVTNTADACTSGISVSLANFQGGLTAGSTQATLSQPSTAGVFNLSLSAPGAGHTGSVKVTAQVPSWLQYNWSNSNTLQDPQALAVFGLYEGSPYEIFFREIY